MEEKGEKTDIDAKTRYDDQFSTCCSRTGTTDARLIRYASRFTISLLMLAFASIQLIRSHECDSLVPFYTSLITFVLGAWIKVDSPPKHDLQK
jgi:hypothetical protein